MARPPNPFDVHEQPSIPPSAFYDQADTAPSEEAAEAAGYGGAHRSPGSPEVEVAAADSAEAAAADEEAKATMESALSSMLSAVSHVAQRDLFHTLQLGSSDELSYDELCALKRIGHNQLTDAELAQVMSEMDVNENGSVSVRDIVSHARWTEPRLTCRRGHRLTSSGVGGAPARRLHRGPSARASLCCGPES